MPQIPIHYYDCDACGTCWKLGTRLLPDPVRQIARDSRGYGTSGRALEAVENRGHEHGTDADASLTAAVLGDGDWRPAPGIARAQAPAADPAPAARPAPPADAALAVSSAIEATASAAGAAVVEIFTMSYAPTEGRVAGTTDLVRTQRATGSGVDRRRLGLHRDQRARRPRRAAHPRRGADRADRRLDPGGARAAAGRPHRRPRSRDRPRRHQGRGDRPADAGVRRLRRAAGRAARGRARQPARLPQLGVARRRERGRPAARARVADGLRAERRGDQLRQQRRTARRPARPHRRHQHARRLARRRRRRGPRLRRAEQHRRAPSTSRSASTDASAAATSACGRRR